MMCTLKIFILLVFISAIDLRRLARIERLEICDYSKDNPFYIDNLNVINPEGKNFLVSGSGKVIREMPHPRLEATVVRCLSKEALDTCERYSVMKPLNTCKLMVMRNMAWTGIVDAIHPQLRCPIKRGDYSLQNGTVDANLFNFFPVDNFYWRVNLSYYDEKNYLTICSEIRVINTVH